MLGIAVLIQGMAERIEAFVADHQWLDQENIYVLSYDRPVDEGLRVFSIFDPDCSWAAGRNALFSAAVAAGRFHGFIFMDDDVAFIEGDMHQFIGLCRANSNLVIAPVVERTVLGRGVLDREFQRPLIIDGQMYYVPAEFIQRSSIYPLVTDYDDVSWWIACEIFQQTLHRCYRKECLQANRIRISNLMHRAGTKGSNYRMSELETVLEIANSHLSQAGMESPFYGSYERRPAGRWKRRYWRLMRPVLRLRAAIPESRIRKPS
ncbi:hypothetical protein [Hoeflea poritis]|uniref:Glycosyltransferase 2-like domain-containing protein n=1 Tax=Hoeflea poritis TaxID=2993659 RepID=A0ABT4VI63_9HYPH|nr:hypothetical protein [Hoeflea poritis]MDA4843885.1 hypothetical protein [Hoeflea poritis]